MCMKYCFLTCILCFCCFVEESRTSISPLVNGRTMWDCGTVTKTYSQSETTLHDQREKTMGDAKERVEELDRGDTNTDLDMDKEPLTAVLHKETDTAPKMSEMQCALKKGVETRKQEDKDIAVCYKDTKGESTTSSDDVSPQQALTAQFILLHTEDSIQEVTCPVQKQTKTETLEVSALKAEETSRTYFPVEQLQLSNLDESQSPFKTRREVTECWDEYVLPTGDLIFDASCEQHDAQVGWHFPAGPGLAQEVQCPFWQLPAGSYYPTLGPTVPFEGK